MSSNQPIHELCDLAATSANSTDMALKNSPFAVRLKMLQGTSEESTTLRLVFAALLEMNRPKIEMLPYPSRVRELVHNEFDRIQTAIEVEDEEYFKFKSHCCRCDLCILAFGRIPVGPEHVEIDGFPFRACWTNGVSQAVRYLRFILSAGGRKPFYVIHLGYGWTPATFLSHYYSKRAQTEMFLNLADCLAMHPEILGVLSGSWWHDEQLDTISPHLSYLRTGWTDHGAELFLWEVSAQIDAVATKNSARRRRLLEEGVYKPKCYMVVWPRKALLHWASATRTKIDV